VVHGLKAGMAKPSDRKSAVPEPDIPFSPDAFAIGTAMRNRSRHCPQDAFIDWRAVKMNDAGNSTH